MTNTRKHFFTYILFICCTFVIALSGCGAKGISSDTVHSNDTDAPVQGASELAYTYCVTEHGMLYPSGHLIRYYDFETDQSYVLCDKANCSHANEQCGAWYDELNKPRGLAIYKNKCYMFRYNYENNTLDFISMDLTGNNQKVLAQSDMGAIGGDGGWELTSVGDIYYVKDTVWFFTDYNYYTEEDSAAYKRVYQGIRLSDGSPVAIDVPDSAPDSEALFLEAVTENYLIFSQQCHEIPLLTADEFAVECEKGTFGTLFGDSEDPYYEYYRKWYPYNNNQTERYLLYTINTGETSLLEEVPTQFQTNPEDDVWGTYPHYIFVGEYDGKLLCDEPIRENDDNHVFLWDMDTNTKSDVIYLENGGIMYYGQNTYDNSVVDGSSFFYIKNTSEHSADAFLFNLDTRQSSDKITELGDDNLHLIAETSDMFICRTQVTIAQFTGTNLYTMYKISKEDYYNGDLDKAVKLNL